MSDFAGGDGGGHIPTDTAGLDFRTQINKYDHRDHGYVDRIQGQYQNHDETTKTIDCMIAVPTGSTVVAWQLPDGARETVADPQSIIARNQCDD